MVVRVALNISLQGFVTAEDQTPEVSFGEDWPCLVAAYAATRTVRKCVFKDISGEGTTGINEGLAAGGFEPLEWTKGEPAHAGATTLRMRYFPETEFVLRCDEDGFISLTGELLTAYDCRSRAGERVSKIRCDFAEVEVIDIVARRERKGWP